MSTFERMKKYHTKPYDPERVMQHIEELFAAAMASEWEVLDQIDRDREEAHAALDRLFGRETP
jgi:hypothetical protein